MFLRPRCDQARWWVQVSLMPGAAPATDQDEGSRQGNFGAQSHSVGSRCLRFAVTVTRPHARLASRLLARLCRTGLVTRRVSTKGFTLLDDSPFPSFVAQGQIRLWGRIHPWSQIRCRARHASYETATLTPTRRRADAKLPPDPGGHSSASGRWE